LSGLDGQHQRNRLGFGGFVQLCRLFGAVVLDDEIGRMQAVNHVSAYVTHQGRHDDHIGLAAEGRFLGESGRSHRESHEEGH
jgi:hypothetical protein